MTAPDGTGCPRLDYSADITFGSYRVMPALVKTGTVSGRTDMDMGAPYYEAVSYVSSKGLFNGTSENTLSPDAEMTRAMFVTVLGRLDGADISKYALPTFTDVRPGEWYTAYVERAAANGIY